MKQKFLVEFLPDAVEFIDSLDEKARDKIIYNIRKSQIIDDAELLKKLNNNIWEFRTLYGGIAYRLFAFWDKHNESGTIILATHGIIKKSNQTPVKEIERAEELRTKYFQQKTYNK
ncbi:type II toxin-antitoxin system RelE/ParE family toxin [Dyadobacter psychrotolerans]|uniref:Type II toxin-antitoxin system RelE/ParE family toxin n=1 Tax=Dyadobacter psychrotolerans TaxID=2541721 RepID=A0A4R5DV95_9BACT|nr:type II toxin-antitoxin system RelE/ParE family toxin [Dyadobacter psychrotolerans]TDE18452.1 type II toxin-antitoxin system RelE/ParE family toxin [Dyadobacter psychrotolerans]